MEKLQRTDERNSLLTLICKTGKRSKDKHLIGLYQCECGNKKEIIISRVINKRTLSCGCLNNKGIVIHGHKSNGVGSPTYITWQSIKRRCLCPDDKDYHRYGAAGITICDEWKNSFVNFLNDVGERPTGKTMDRINPLKGYEKGNVRWATPSEQARNRKNLVLVNFNGKNMALVDVAEELNISNGAAHMRHKRKRLEGVNYHDREITRH